MSNFATIADIEDFLQVVVSSGLEQDCATRALAEASEVIRNYCRQKIDYVTNEHITMDSYGGTLLFLPELPVISVSSVVVNGVALVQNTDYKLDNRGALHRLLGHMWPVGPRCVVVTYTHGLSVIPADIVGVCTRAAARAYQAGLKSNDTSGVPGVASKSLGDFSVAYQAESSGTVDGGTMGASAARMLLMSEKDILDKYRI